MPVYDDDDDYGYDDCGPPLGPPPPRDGYGDDQRFEMRVLNGSDDSDYSDDSDDGACGC